MDTQLKPAERARSGQPKTAPASPPEQDDTPEAYVMGFFDHLAELRNRLIKAFLGLAVTTGVSLLFAGRILEYLISPVGREDFLLQTLGPTEGVVIYFRVALLAGGILSIPWITWQLWMFIAPGLTRKERRYVLLSLPATTLLFLVGVLFAWFLLMPAALNFLQNFQSDIFKADWTADQYVAFVTSLLFWIGVSFEMPLIFFILARLGLVSPRALRQNWRLAVVGASMAAAMITPTIDPFNMMLVMGPLLALYALSVLLSTIAYRQSGMAD
ncbi:MAG: twin-arginine translocase subunit TatC [Anaerolineae bacterium]|nr:twin-arginine translocase subunit TatC [Anaerolineae bacterium]